MSLNFIDNEQINTLELDDAVNYLTSKACEINDCENINRLTGLSHLMIFHLEYLTYLFNHSSFIPENSSQLSPDELKKQKQSNILKYLSEKVTCNSNWCEKKDVTMYFQSAYHEQKRDSDHYINYIDTSDEFVCLLYYCNTCYIGKHLDDQPVHKILCKSCLSAHYKRQHSNIPYIDLMFSILVPFPCVFNPKIKDPCKCHEHCVLDKKYQGYRSCQKICQGQNKRLKESMRSNLRGLKYKPKAVRFFAIGNAMSTEINLLCGMCYE